MVGLLKNIKDLEGQLLKIDSITIAKVYLGDDNYYYLIAAVGINGIQAKEKQVIDSIIDFKHIPIEEENPSAFQKHQETISNLEVRINTDNMWLKFSYFKR